MKMNDTILRILGRAQDGIAPSKVDCIAMFDCPPTSVEAAMTRAVADSLSRRRFGNEGVILGQIGIEIDSCPGQCKFCSFGDGHTQFQPSKMSVEEIVAAAKTFTKSGDLYALFLMTMHTFDFERLLDAVSRIRAQMPKKPVHPRSLGSSEKFVLF